MMGSSSEMLLIGAVSVTMTEEYLKPVWRAIERLRGEIDELRDLVNDFLDAFGPDT